eukprot:403348884
MKALLLSLVLLTSKNLFTFGQVAEPNHNENVQIDRGVTPDQIEQIAADATLKDNNSVEDAQLMKEWEQYMHDFVPEDMTTIVIEPKQEVSFYEDVGQDSIYIRGAYFVGQSNGKNKFIDFFVLDPNNKVVFSRRKAEEGIFRFNTTIPGTYTFVFSNMKDRRGTKDVTLAIHTPGNDELNELLDGTKESLDNQPLSDSEQALIQEGVVEDDDIRSIRQYLKTIFSDLRHISMEAKFSSYRQYTHNDAVEDNSRYNLYMVALESLAFIAICFAQVYHIKNFLENKRVI